MDKEKQRPAEPDILVIGHGSRDKDAINEFMTVAENLRARFPNRRVETGFLEFARPTIDTGATKLIEAGATNITAIPGMLMAAGHAKNDIPSEINALSQAYPHITFTYGTEIGIQAAMLRAAKARIEEAEAALGETYTRENTLLLVVGRGANDSDANSNISKITRMLWEGMGFGWAETCYSGVTRPLVDEALETSLKLGYPNIIVFPYFLFTGILIKQKIYAVADEFQAQNPHINVMKAGYLNDHPEVIQAFVDRLHDTEEGTGVMNCQLCKYREQIVGFESDVGTPQAGHHHHVRGIGTDSVHHSHPHDHTHTHEHDHEHVHKTHPMPPRQTPKSS
ncbi:MAG TPA: sirohydrochlorin chelatase [Gammaproteobacteria bacterium]|nr:sirohydrochlorin chelatase [Gammaproteobacteria bacterium]